LGPGRIQEAGVSEEQKDRRVRVIDRRWFNADGEPREDLPEPRADEPVPPPPSPDPPPQPPSPEVTERAAETAETAPVKLPQRVLLDLVDFLSQYAMALLSGQVAGLDRDPSAARLFIDLLAEVQRRTKDQLSLQEAKVLDDVLFQLRAYYISPR
jgi:hypothetical protein